MRQELALFRVAISRLVHTERSEHSQWTETWGTSPHGARPYVCGRGEDGRSKRSEWRVNSAAAETGLVPAVHGCADATKGPVQCCVFLGALGPTRSGGEPETRPEMHFGNGEVGAPRRVSVPLQWLRVCQFVGLSSSPFVHCSWVMESIVPVMWSRHGPAS